MTRAGICYCSSQKSSGTTVGDQPCLPAYPACLPSIPRVETADRSAAAMGGLAAFYTTLN